jgi:hypothetical protein
MYILHYRGQTYNLGICASSMNRDGGSIFYKACIIVPIKTTTWSILEWRKSCVNDYNSYCKKTPGFTRRLLIHLGVGMCLFFPKDVSHETYQPRRRRGQHPIEHRIRHMCRNEHKTTLTTPTKRLPPSRYTYNKSTTRTCLVRRET